jgi:hypothetical protein
MPFRIILLALARRLFIYLRVLTNPSEVEPVQTGKIGRLMNSKLESMWKEVTVD